MTVALDSEELITAWAHLHFDKSVGFDDSTLAQDKVEVNPGGEVLTAWAFIHESIKMVSGIPEPTLTKKLDGRKQLSVWYTARPIIVNEANSKQVNLWKKIWTALQYELAGLSVTTIPNPVEAEYQVNLQVESMKSIEKIMRAGGKWRMTLHPDFTEKGRETMTEKKRQANIGNLMEARKVRVAQQKQEADERAHKLVSLSANGLSHEEIAQHLSIKPESVRVELWRAQQRLAPQEPTMPVQAPTAAPEPCIDHDPTNTGICRICGASLTMVMPEVKQKPKREYDPADAAELLAGIDL